LDVLEHLQGTPARLPLLLNIVLLPQPCSNDWNQEIVRVHVGFHFYIAEPKHQSKFVDFSISKLSRYSMMSTILSSSAGERE